MKIDVSVVIVNYRTPKLTCKCIQTITEKTKDVSYEIIIIDNNSEDGSAKIIKENFPDVKVIEHHDNAGTSIAYNIGINEAKGDYILIQNSDTEYYENTIKIALEEYKNLEKKEKIGLLGCQIIGYDKIVQYNSNMQFFSIKYFLRSNPICIKLNLFQYKELEKDRELLHLKYHEPAWLGIPFGLFNAKICKEKQFYFDQDIFMYCDDEEWCYRLIKKGYKHIFSPKTSVYHVNGASSENISDWRVGQITVSRLLFLLKKNGKFLYLLSGLLFLFNKSLFSLLNKKNKKVNNLSLEEIELEIISKYYFRVLKYDSNPSLKHNYLKYEA